MSVESQTNGGSYWLIVVTALGLLSSMLSLLYILFKIDVEQNDQSYFLRHGHSQSHCFITNDSVKFYHDCKRFEDMVYLYAFYPAWIFSALVELDSAIFDFNNKVLNSK